MKNLVQIICGCAAAETIEECARVPQMLGATIIVVHGLWPKIDYVTVDSPHAVTENWADPTDQIDNVAEIAQQNGWHFIQMDRFAYNGEQYNTAIDYIRDHNIPCDHIWFADADESLDPEYIPLLLQQVQQLKDLGAEQLRFSDFWEIVPNWRYFTINAIEGNQGIVWGNAAKLHRETFFDGNHYFKGDVIFGGTTVPLLHLHHFRKNAADRIFDGAWHGGGKTIDLASETEPLPETEYIRFLQTKYSKFYQERRSAISSYVGPGIYENKTIASKD